MISLDTNVLADDAGQHRRAVAALDADEDSFIPVTVLLELAWISALRKIVDLPRALDWIDAGLDVADAFYLALSERSDNVNPVQLVSEWQGRHPFQLLPRRRCD